MKLKDYIEEIPDFPVNGILFRDISPLIANYQAMSYVKASFLDIIKSYRVDYIGGIDARGFLFSTLIADALGVGSFMIRKEGKLPGKVITKEYSLEYGISKMSIRQNINLKNKNIILVDDLLATGGTLRCGEELVNYKEGNVLFSLTVIELVKLNGHKNLNSKVYSLVKYND